MPLVFPDLHKLILPICHLHHPRPPRRLWRQLMKRHHGKNCQLFDPINQGSAKEVDVFRPQIRRRCVLGHIYVMKNQFWTVGCGLGWTVKKKVWADYEQILRPVFFSIHEYFFFF